MPIFSFLKKKKKVNKSFNSLGFRSFFLGNKTPIWVNTQKQKSYAKVVEENPVLYATLNLRASAIANGEVKIKDLQTGEVVTRENFKQKKLKNTDLIKKAFRLFYNPNPLQSRWEYLKSYLYFKDTFGNSYEYGFKPSGFPMNLENIESFWNIWPQYMNVMIKNNIFQGQNIEDIIEKWIWGKANDVIFNSDEILHRKDVNIRLNDSDDIIFGTSRIDSLIKPISNINMAYESQNVVLRNRGASI